jgi:hypothetical protein
MADWWGVRFDRRTGPALRDIPHGTWAFRNPVTGQWYIMWPTPQR